MKRINKDHDIIKGMEIALRICRNRAADSRRSLMASDAETCAGIIRIVQVELGSGRMDVPEFTQDEQDEINRIS